MSVITHDKILSYSVSVVNNTSYTTVSVSVTSVRLLQYYYNISITYR